MSKQVLIKFFVLFILSALATFFVILVRIAYWELDLTDLYLPYKLYQAQRLQSGEIPLWVPYIFSGLPVLGDPQNSIFYPFNLLMLFLMNPSYEVSSNLYIMELFIILHIILGGFGMFKLSFYLNKGNFWASMLSSAIFSFSSFIATHVIHFNIVESAVWLPYIVYYLLKYINQKHPRRYLYISALFFGFSSLAGHPQISYMISLFIMAIFGYGLFWLIKAKQESWFNITIGFFKNILTYFIIVVGIASVVYLPSLSLVSLSHRADEATRNIIFASSHSSDPVYFIINSFFPHAFLTLNKPVGYWEISSYFSPPFILILFLGVYFSKLKTFLIGLFRKKVYLVFFSWSFLISLLLSFGLSGFLFIILYYVVPFLNFFRVPARFILFSSLSYAVVVGTLFTYILQKLRRDSSSGLLILKRSFYVTICLIIIIGLYLLGSFTFRLFSLQATLEDFDLARRIALDFIVGIFISSLLFLIIKAYINRRIFLNKTLALVFLIFILDFFTYNLPFNLAFQYHLLLRWKEEIKNGTSLDDIISKSSKTFTKIAVENSFLARKAFPINSSLISKTYMIDGWTALGLKDYEAFLESYFLTGYAKLGIISLRRENRLKILNVEYVILTDKELVRFYERSNLFKRIPVDYKDIAVFKALYPTNYAVIVSSYKVINKENMLSFIDSKDFDPHREVVFEELPQQLPSEQKDITISKASDIKIVLYKPEYVEMETYSNYDGYLILPEVYFPGWKAFVDGKEMPIYKANYIFRAIYLPQGSHRVIFKYPFPRELKIGLAVSLTTFIMTIGLIFKHQKI